MTQGVTYLARNWKFESICEPSVPLGFRDRDILDLIGRTRDRGLSRRRQHRVR